MALKHSKINQIIADKRTIFNAIILVSIFLFMMSYFRPDLIFLDTTTAGGDTGSHNYSLWYLKSYLLPEGKLTGWSMGWYGGFPIFQFYFVLPFLLMTAISYILPLWVSFKIVTVLGAFLLPVAAYFSMKMMNFKFPAPILAAVFTLPFLFMEANSMWGGNIPSTLAGEFSYSLSLAFTVLFIGVFYRSVRINQKSVKLILISSIFLSLALLCHIYTAIFAVFASSFLLLGNSKKDVLKNFIHFFKVYAIAAIICSFWAIPLLAKMSYASSYHYIWIINDLMDVFPPILLPFLFLACVGIYNGIKSADNRILYLSFALVISLILYLVAPTVGLTDIRFIPMLQLFSMLVAAYLVACVFRKSRRPWLVVVIISILVIFWVQQNVTYIDYWIEWNYEGFQSKDYWNELESTMVYLTSLPDGRSVHEYSGDHDKYGTPRTLENIPLFSNKSTLEGLNIESALSAPYVFVIQAEISETSTCPIPGLVCGAFNITKAERHLEMFNIKYVVATTDKLKYAIESNTDWVLLDEFGELSIYDTGGSSYVEPVKYKPYLIFNYSKWNDLSLQWFRDSEYLDTYLGFTENPDGVDSGIRFNHSIDSIDEIERVPIDSDCTIFSESITNDEIIFNTDCIGSPVLIKVSYFPNWQVEGADKIYAVSPSFMLVYPEQENVRMYYGYTVVDYVAYGITIFGTLAIVLVLVLAKVKPQKIYKHFR